MAIYSLLNQSEQNTNADFSRMQTNFISGAGVVDLDGGDCEVTENGTPNLSVNVAAGSGYILNDSWTQNSGLVQFVEYENTATENVAINSNSSGNPRITSIFAKFDASANPGTRSDGAVSFAAVDGTASATPSAPAVPSDGNSYLRLANITVSSGAASISNADIADTRSRVGISLNKTATVTRILDEDDMASDADGALATQQSIKAYVDNESSKFVDVNGNAIGSRDILVGTQVVSLSGGSSSETEQIDVSNVFNNGDTIYGIIQVTDTSGSVRSVICTVASGGNTVSGGNIDIVFRKYDGSNLPSGGIRIQFILHRL